jgi:hypothetical protein
MPAFSRKLGWVLVLTVLLLFLFPLHFGSFTQTHGPTTAMRALMAAQMLFTVIALSATVATRLIAFCWHEQSDAPVPAFTSNGSSFQLRC